MRKLKCLFSAALILFSFLPYAQGDFCETHATGVFWPIQIGVKRFYVSSEGSYTELYNGDSLTVRQNTYYKKISQKSDGETSFIYTREKEGDVFIYDTDNKLEFLELPGNTTPVYTWEKYDKSWKYSVIDTNTKRRCHWFNVGLNCRYA